MTDHFSDALASLHLNQDAARSFESSSSVDSSYTRRGQTESEADIRAGLAAARDLASRKKRFDVDNLSSSPGTRGFQSRSLSQTLETDDSEERESPASGSKTLLPDTSESGCIADLLMLMV